MKINLDYKIDIEINENDKSKEKLVVFIREPNRAEKKEQEALQSKFKKIYKRLSVISTKQNGLTKKAELHELNCDYEEALDAINKRDSFDNEIEELNVEVEKIGGEDKESFMENIAKDRFSKLVSGDDKEKLEEYAQSNSYVVIMHLLGEAKAKLEKKQFGE